MPRHKVEIHTGDGTRDTHVLLDGQLVKGLQRFRLEQAVGQLRPVLTLILHPLTTTVDGKEVDVALFKPEKVS